MTFKIAASACGALLSGSSSFVQCHARRAYRFSVFFGATYGGKSHACFMLAIYGRTKNGGNERFTERESRSQFLARMTLNENKMCAFISIAAAPIAISVGSLYSCCAYGAHQSLTAIKEHRRTEKSTHARCPLTAIDRTFLSSGHTHTP